MDYLQYGNVVSEKDLKKEVLNLIINGLPSICQTDKSLQSFHIEF